jgi:hypothetical protein
VVDGGGMGLFVTVVVWVAFLFFLEWIERGKNGEESMGRMGSERYNM